MAYTDYNDYDFSSDNEISTSDSNSSAEAESSGATHSHAQNNNRLNRNDYQNHDNIKANQSSCNDDPDYYARFNTDRERYDDDQHRFQALGQVQQSRQDTSEKSSKATITRKPNQKREGITFDENGNLCYYFLKRRRVKGNVYEKERAVFHHWIRAQLSRMENVKGRYAFPAERGRGLGSWDITCFCPVQRDWGLVRANYAPIMFEYERLNRENPQYHVGNLYYEGLLVIDYKEKPVRAYEEIPLVISSVFEGGFIEPAMRIHRDIAYSDIRARQPPFIEIERPTGTRTKNNVNSIRPLRPMYGCNALSQRARRFRERAGGISWHPEVNSPAVKAFMDKCPSQAARVGNSTRNCSDLTADELAQLRTATALSSPENAKKSATAEGKMKYRQQFDSESPEPGVETPATSSQPLALRTRSTPSPPPQTEHGRDDDPQQSGPDEQTYQPDHYAYLVRGPIVADMLTFSEALHRPDVDLEDPRHAFPTNLDEIIAIQEALLATARRFKGFVSYWPATTRWTSYINQYYEIQGQFMQWWGVDLAEMPRLYRRQRWGNDIMDLERGIFGPPIEPEDLDGSRDYLGLVNIGQDWSWDASPQPGAPLPLLTMNQDWNEYAAQQPPARLQGAIMDQDWDEHPSNQPKAPLPGAIMDRNPTEDAPQGPTTTLPLSMLEQRPTTEADQEILQMLLMPTRIHFARLTGRSNDAEVFEENSYVDQYARYQAALYDWARTEGQGFIPWNSNLRLIGLVEYSSERAVWNMRWEEAWFGPRLDLEGMVREQRVVDS